VLAVKEDSGDWHCMEPVTCEFFVQCNPPRAEDHVGYLPRIHASAMEELDKL
jgi:hypothetical protein